MEAGLFTGALALVGLGSAFYHSSLTFVGQVFDVSGMYLIATFILLHRLGPKWGVSPMKGVLGFVGITPEFVHADGVNYGPEQREAGIANGLSEVERLAA